MSAPPAEAGTRWRPSPFLRFSLGLHAAGAAALVVSPGAWPWIGGALLLDHAVIGAGTLWPQSPFLGPNLVRLEGEAARGRVALTFDDGPDPEVTPAVLDLLDVRGARATFFCIGRKVDAHPDLAAEIHRRGHAVENHTYGHPHSFGFHGRGRMAAQIARAQDAVERATGRRPVFFRAPVGIRNPFLDPVLARAGLTLVSWTRRGLDTVRRDAAGVAHRLIDGLGAGDILLLHDGSSARDAAGRPVVLEALPRVLDALAGRALTSVALVR
jgi:peptidoglycan/xylan/chitin deacetylase (PgdA/CDA1 family)